MKLNNSFQGFISYNIYHAGADAKPVCAPAKPVCAPAKPVCAPAKRN